MNGKMIMTKSAKEAKRVVSVSNSYIDTVRRRALKRDRAVAKRVCGNYDNELGVTRRADFRDIA